jgi:hypothetical protein
MHPAIRHRRAGSVLRGVPKRLRICEAPPTTCAELFSGIFLGIGEATIARQKET